MARISEHCEDCAAVLGDPCREVNEWLDELFDKLGPDHRDIRHNEKGVEKVRKMWGDRAALAAEIHIRRDEGCIPKVDAVFKLRVAMNVPVRLAYIEEYGSLD